jgi:hypothetical protein
MTFFIVLFFKKQEDWKKVPFSRTSGNSGRQLGSAKFYSLGNEELNNDRGPGELSSTILVIVDFL